MDPANPKYKLGVVVCSDRAFGGVYEDLSGPAAANWAVEHDFDVLDNVVVSDEDAAISEAVTRFVDERADAVIVSGGTGLAPRDRTPQVIEKLSDYHIPGIGEFLRVESQKYTGNAYLSRCGGWAKGGVLILALPGNPKAVREQLDIMADLLPHCLKALKGQCKHRNRIDGS